MNASEIRMKNFIAKLQEYVAAYREKQRIETLLETSKKQTFNIAKSVFDFSEGACTSFCIDDIVPGGVLKVTLIGLRQKDSDSYKIVIEPITRLVAPSEPVESDEDITRMVTPLEPVESDEEHFSDEFEERY